MATIILTPTGLVMNKKPVLLRNAKTVLNCKNAAFKEKCLCDGITLNAGDACAASCAYCYVEAQLQKLLSVPLEDKAHQNVVIRRNDAIDLLKSQLFTKHGKKRFDDPHDNRVVYSSTLVDCAGNLTLARETAQMAVLIFENTNWQLRLLSKFNFFPQVVGWIPKCYHHRLIFGVSTGTLDDRVAAAIEKGTASVTQRIKSLHWLQDHGLRTFAMVCPSLPQVDYVKFARDMAAALRIDQCEHIWAEAINLRGKSFRNTMQALIDHGLTDEALRLKKVCGPKSKPAWEEYARATFEAEAFVFPPSKLRFLQYVTAQSAAWWASKIPQGAVLLGKHAASILSTSSTPTPLHPPAGLSTCKSVRSIAARKAWVTMRVRYSLSDITQRQRTAAAKAWQTRRKTK